MNVSPLILTYHAIGAGEGPLFVDERTFAAHLDCIVRSGVHVQTVSELVRGLRAGTVDGPVVSITFDDGAASVVRIAAPLLAARGLTATVFCVAGHLGGANDWPTARPGGPCLDIAHADELATLSRYGVEIGCHGMTHAPLVSESRSFLERELVAAKDVLEEIVEEPVSVLAFPYGARPSTAAREIIASCYMGACSTEVGRVGSRADVYALPRVDAHYVRRESVLRLALQDRLSPYLKLRRAGSRTRRKLIPDYVDA